jgi:5-methylcytosine-specific restriction endonuclease McrA
MSGSWITKERRLAIYIRDEFTCGYCGRNMKNDGPETLTLDHLIPRNVKVSHGSGGNESTNLVTACHSCNSARQDKPYMDYATGGARDRIETRRYQPVNITLAKSLIEGRIAATVAEVESLR